jgi:aspartyl protease family protein
MSNGYAPSGGALLRRVLLLALGCGIAAYTVPQYFGALGLGDITQAPAPARAPARSVPQAAMEAPALPDAAVTESFRAEHGNQFFVTAAVNGHPIRFVVDTGATLVSLTPDDARALGFDLDALGWTIATKTANGDGRAAAVTVKELRLGRVTEYNVPALVMRAPGAMSLLGMSFLSRLKSWQIQDGVLTIAS